MKRFITILLVCVLALSCTACSWHQGDTERQEKEMLEYVEKYHGAAEIVSKEHMILDTATYFTLKDKTDGFTYGMAAMEVFMSDLGYTTADDGHDHESQEKVVVFEGNFTEAYISHMVENIIPKTDIAELADKYADNLLNISILEYQATAVNVLQYTTYDTVLVMRELNFDALNEAVALMRKYDKRNILNDYIIPIYQAAQENGELTIVKDNNGQPVVLGFYDFYLSGYFAADDFAAVSMAHDYLRNLNVETPKLVKVEDNIAKTSLTLPDGWALLPDTNDTGSMVTYKIGDKTFKMFTMLCRHEFKTEQDEYGLYKDSFLDLMATEKVGGRPVLISVYASMYPNYYTSIDVFVQEVTE